MWIKYRIKILPNLRVRSYAVISSEERIIS